MGAVQKLATVVMVGLVALATSLVVYLADEPNRRGSETDEQEHVAIERGTDLYVTYCLQCHGPSGYGLLGADDPPRVGGVLNQEPLIGTENQPDILFQSDDPVQREQAEAWIRYMITYGVPQDPRIAEKSMPAFGEELNVEEINDLVYLIMYGDWNYVYNQSLLTTGESVAQAECDATPPSEPAEENADQCERVEDPDPVYPTSPPQETEGEDEAAATPQPSGEGGVTIEAQDPYAWSTNAVTVAPGDTITVINTGFAEHDFVIDELGIDEVLPPGEPVTITIPEDAAAGDVIYYCSVTGHRQGGMEGTMTIAAP